MPVPNTSNAEQFQKHPEGRFAFVVKSAEETIRQSDGEPVAKIILEPIGNGSGNRPDMMVNFTLSDSWLWKLRAFIEALGMPIEGGYSWDHLTGKKVVAWVIHTESKGKTYANVNDWEAFDEGAESKPGLGTLNPTQTGDDAF